MRAYPRRLGVCVVALCAWAAMTPGTASAFIPPPPAGTFTAVSIGSTVTAGTGCALRTDQTIACWGANDFGLATPPTGTFTQVDVGIGSARAVRTDQTVACWGQNSAGETIPPAGAFTRVAVGVGAACGVRADSTLTCWGSGITAPAGTFTDISGGAGQWFCAVRSDTAAICTLPSFDGPTTGVAQVSADGFFNCAVRTDGTLAPCWGQLVPGLTPPAGTFLTVAVGRAHACALRTDHTVACWGAEIQFSGETRPPAGTFIAVAADALVSCGVRTDGTLACWGAVVGAPAAAPAGAAPAGPVAAVAPNATPGASRLPRLPTAFGSHGAFSLPSNRSCVSRRRFRIRVHPQRAGVTLVSAAVAVNGKRVAVRKGRRLTAPVDLRGLPRGRFTVRISALTADGRAISGTRRYRTCAPKAPSSGSGPV
jgi:hypothetical protein